MRFGRIKGSLWGGMGVAMYCCNVLLRLILPWPLRITGIKMTLQKGDWTDEIRSLSSVLYQCLSADNPGLVSCKPQGKKREKTQKESQNEPKSFRTRGQDKCDNALNRMPDQDDQVVCLSGAQVGVEMETKESDSLGVTWNPRTGEPDDAPSG